MKQAFFTYSSGIKYLHLAYTLARSYLYHNGNNIPFYIVSNNDFKLPKDLEDYISKKIISKEMAGKGLDFKLQLDLIAPEAESIFIDADSIIYGPILNLFSLFPKANLNVIGTKVKMGEWVDESIPYLIEEFKLKYVIRYCGALYYLRKGEPLSNLFNSARELKKNRKFQQHRHNFNEEPILSILMSKLETEPIIDDGNIWGDLFHFNAGTSLNVLCNEQPVLFNSPLDQNKFWLPNGHYSPSIIHMGSSFYNKNPWLFDSLKLKLYFKFKLSKSISSWLVETFVKKTYFLFKKFK